MPAQRADALVFFGATGDLAFKKIFPSLQAMVKRGALDIPVIAVANTGWDTHQLRARAYDSLKHHGSLDSAAFDELSHLWITLMAITATRRHFGRCAGNLEGAKGLLITWRFHHCSSRQS